MQAKNICLLNDSFPPVIDGVSNCVVNYAKNIKALGGSPLVATPSVEGADDGAFDFPVFRYPSIDTRKKLGYVTGYPFSPAVTSEIKDAGVDILHTHCPVTSCLFARSLRYVVDAPVILTYHTKFDIDVSNALRGRLLQESALRALMNNIRACDEVWVVSRGAGENLRKLGYEGDFVVMKNGVDVPIGGADETDVAAATEGCDLPDGVPVYLFVGRMMWYKNVRLILDALKRLRNEDKDFRMIFIGGGADAEEIEKYASELELSDKCFFKGPVRDRAILRAWYTRADLFLFPSTFDTNGLVVREAAACGTASILIYGSAASEGVVSGKNGFLIDEEPEALAGCLSGLYGNDDFVKQTGQAAARDLYISWSDAVAKACERYDIVLDKYRSGQYEKKAGDGFFKSQGELMGFLSLVENQRRSVRTNLGAARSAILEHKNELKNEISYAYENLVDRMDRFL
jgi:glycosyltransferase involved in cell wall biosynthesis